MGLFGPRRMASKDTSTQERGGLAPADRGASRLPKLASLFSDTVDVELEKQRDKRMTTTDKAAPTVAMDDFDPTKGGTRPEGTSGGQVSSPRSNDDKFEDLERSLDHNTDRKRGTKPGGEMRADAVSRNVQRDSIKRSVSRKFARSESRRQSLQVADRRAEGSEKAKVPAGISSSTGDLDSDIIQHSKNSDQMARLSLSPITNDGLSPLPPDHQRNAPDYELFTPQAAGSLNAKQFALGKGGEDGTQSGSNMPITCDSMALKSLHEVSAMNTPQQARSRRRPPPLLGSSSPGASNSVADWPSGGIFGSDGGFMTGGFRITEEGMLDKPALVTREDSDPEADGGAPMSYGAQLFIGGLKEFRTGPTIGAGAAGRVYITEHMPSSTTMAMKVVNVYNKEKRNQLLKELETLSTHVSRYLVRFYGAFYNGSGGVHIALEYMDHGCLSTFVQRVGRIPEPVVQMIALDCIRGLRFLHRHHVLHRDFKTANILLSRKLCCAKLSDFGLARDLNAGAVSKVDTFVGTVAYMSPERLQGHKYTYASDIWALGLSIVECLLGRHPFNRPQNYFDFIEATASSGLLNAFDAKEQRFSPAARDFVTLCTFSDAKKRPTAVELLDHEWIRGMKRDVETFGAWLDECRTISMRLSSPNVPAD